MPLRKPCPRSASKSGCRPNPRIRSSGTAGVRGRTSRLCIARRGEIQALISFDFWADDLERCDVLWHDILATIQVAEWVEDPAKGPLLA